MEDNNIINKEAIEQSFSLLSEIEFEEEDYEQIFGKFKETLKSKNAKKVLNKVSQLNPKDEADIVSIMKLLLKELDAEDIKKMVGDVIKNEKLVDYIQDLFLEKLL